MKASEIRNLLRRARASKRAYHNDWSATAAKASKPTGWRYSIHHPKHLPTGLNFTSVGEIEARVRRLREDE